MTGLAETLSQIARFKRPGGHGETSTDLAEVTGFGPNPGALRMFTHVPAGLRPGAPLVVVLHGCTQSAASYDRGAGWSALADRHGFAVLFPEQTSANNPNGCFNWFQPADTARDAGEARSIRAMIARMVADHRTDPARVFVTGLSAGGALTASMLAAYPEVFAGGAVIAGLPAGAADTVPGALEAMFQGRSHSAREWGDMVRGASAHRGPWPRVQIWHGEADHTVKPSNAGELAKQWSDVHGLSAVPDTIDVVDGAAHQAWRDRAGHVVLETFMVPRMGHGTPLDTHSDDMDRASGAAGPHMLEAGIGSTWHIARSWGLLTVAARARTARPATKPEAKIAPLFGLKLPIVGKLPIAAKLPSPTEVIGKAMRAAGLLTGKGG